MRYIDKKWVVLNKNIFHLCQGEVVKNILPGIWPVKEIDGKKKCSICFEEPPNHVLIYT